jgi:hypothetical protein
VVSERRWEDKRRYQEVRRFKVYCMYMYEYSIMKPNKYCLERRGEGRSKGI